MSSTSSGHEEYPELVSLYALHALPADEHAAVEAHISACADCRQELERLRPVIDSIAAWPSHELSPSPSLWDRLAQRIAAETGTQPALPAPQRWADAEWKEVASGISCKLLATDTEKSRVAMLVRLAPGAEYVAHRHVGIEECYVLEGALIIDDKMFYPGDYRQADAGSVDHRTWSDTGCSCLVITSSRDAIL